MTTIMSFQLALAFSLRQTGDELLTDLKNIQDAWNIILFMFRLERKHQKTSSNTSQLFYYLSRKQNLCLLIFKHQRVQAMCLMQDSEFLCKWQEKKLFWGQTLKQSELWDINVKTARQK